MKRSQRRWHRRAWVVVVLVVAATLAAGTAAKLHADRALRGTDVPGVR